MTESARSPIELDHPTVAEATVTENNATAVAAEPKIVMNWTVTQQYHREFTPEQWAAAMEYFDGLDPTDLDACYARIERQDWRAEEFLADAARDRYWVDTSEAQISDLDRVGPDAH